MTNNRYISAEGLKDPPYFEEEVLIEIFEDVLDTVIGEATLNGAKLPLKLVESHSSRFDKFGVEVVFALHEYAVIAYTNKFNDFLRRPDQLKTAKYMISAEDLFYPTDKYHAVFV